MKDREAGRIVGEKRRVVFGAVVIVDTKGHGEQAVKRRNGEESRWTRRGRRADGIVAVEVVGHRGTKVGQGEETRRVDARGSR